MYSKKINQELNLPDTVPWLGFEDNLFISSGITGGYGNARGYWYNITGPAFSLNSFVYKCRMKAVINGRQHIINAPMHRGKETGIYYSTSLRDSIYYYLIDYAPRGANFLVRMIAFHNVSDCPVAVAPYAELKRTEYTKYAGAISESTRFADAFHLTQEDKYYLSALYAETSTISRIYEEEKETVLTTEPYMLMPGSTKYFSLYIMTYTSDIQPEDAVKYIVSRNSIQDLNTCHTEWKNWLSQGRDLSFIKDSKAYNIVESTRILIRMQQGMDGGIMSTPGAYTYCYIRDNHSALRGMMAAGDMDVSREYLLFINRLFYRLKNKGYFAIPNACPIGIDSQPFFGFDNEDNWSNETPGLYVLTVKRYYELTGDLELVRELWDIITYAIEKQLDFACKNNYTMIFNGDETESGGCAITMKESIIHGKTRYSMPSQVICIASAEFYVNVIPCIDPQTDTQPIAEIISKLKNVLEEKFWNQDRNLYDWMLELDDARCHTLMPNYHIMPLYFGVGFPERVKESALAMKKYILPNGTIPNQIFSESNDFTGHNLGYLLYALTELDDPVKDRVYQSLKDTADCWGLWSEAYDFDGIPYGFGQTWDGRRHTLRPFESGVNIEAIIKYWEGIVI